MDLTDLERRIRALEDIEAIKQLKYRYADACDRGYDANTLADLFTEDAIWDGGVFGRYDGQEAIRNYFRGVSSDIVFAMHYMMNSIIEVDGDQARGAWYLFQTCTFAEGNTPILGAAKYAERYQRVHGTWKFRHLQLISIFWTPYEEGWVKRPFIQDGEI
jgi:ketosteroid isomerase-like protein